MAHLLTLPLEIQQMICANLCRHCTSESFEPIKEPVMSLEPPIDLETHHEACFKGAKAFVMDNARIRIAALSAMTQTCTTLQRIAQPYLYHYPCARAPAVSKLLLRTLVERPILAQYIDQLSMFDMECREIKSVLRFMLDIREFRDSREERTQWHIRQCHKYHNPPVPGKPVKLVNIKYNFATAFTALILPFGASLQVLHLEWDRGRKFPSCEPGSFPRLKELVVKSWDGGNPADITVIASILIAAPALERLGGLAVYCNAYWKTPRPPIHEGVKEIWFERCLATAKGLIPLLGLFPRLEAFTYEPDCQNFDEDETSPSEISQAILLCQDLRFLSLDFTKSQYVYDISPTEQLGSLAELKKLEKFRVKGFPLPSTTPWEHTPWTGPPGVKIYEMLPASITELEVTRPNNIIFDEMLELSRVASQRFPLLKHVSIDGIEQDRRAGHLDMMGWKRINELRQAFQQSGIELFTGDFGKYRCWQI
ncbi:hypothetical protein NCS52_01331500 [Fusarium sp. LHS14.1]|nr:hypothetical protein NCS52_01331500 [Fusarium sp. LHS14.1]